MTSRAIVQLVDVAGVPSDVSPEDGPASSVGYMSKPGDLLRDLRKALGLTQEQAADLTPVDNRLRRNQWTRLETGNFLGSKRAHMEAVAAALDIGMDELLSYLKGEVTLERTLEARVRRRAAPPKFCDHPHWTQILADARSAAPGLDARVWDGLAEMVWMWAPSDFEKLSAFDVAQIALGIAGALRRRGDGGGNPTSGT
jgi:transcriptional regulator with XRE-family HTH domain